MNHCLGKGNKILQYSQISVVPPGPEHLARNIFARRGVFHRTEMPLRRRNTTVPTDTSKPNLSSGLAAAPRGPHRAGSGRLQQRSSEGAGSLGVDLLAGLFFLLQSCAE